MSGGVHDRGHVWQGVCVVRGVHGRRHAWRGEGGRVCVAGDMASAADGTTGMHSCLSDKNE